jgi:hypothetical protein
VKAWIAEEDLDRALGGWIAAKNGIDLLPNCPEHDAAFDYLTAAGDSAKMAGPIR